MAKTKRLITVTAGRLVFSVCYSQALASDSPQERAAKSKCSSAARKRMNFNTSWQKLQLLLATNFTRRDLYITLTYSDDCLPKSRRDAQLILARFIKQLRAQRRADGEDLRYIYSTQELLDDGGRRLHHHMVVNATIGKRDYELIRSLWKYGDNIEIDAIGDTEYYQYDDFLELACYLARERNPDAPPTAVGARGWTPSTNLKKPKRESVMVEDNITVTAPPGAYVLDTDEKQNEYGYYKYIKYLLPAPKQKRQRRKKE